MKEFRAFTLKATCIMDRLQTDIFILSDYRKSDEPYKPKMWRGLWDTGASKSSITQRIVDNLSLIPISQAKVNTANGFVIANTYLVDILLLNGVNIKNVLVSCCDLGDDVDVLIGMDIISLGDFSITNVDNKTTFSFRTPSIKEIDYVEEQKEIETNL